MRKFISNRAAHGLNRPRAVMLVCVLSFLLLAACGGGAQNGNTDAGESSEVKTGVKPEPDAEVAVLNMEDPAYGKIVIELYPNIAPLMVERFKRLAREGFYNGVAFHRVEPPTPTNPGGVVQGGDPNSKDDDYSDDGRGGSDYPDVPAERSDVPHELGTVGAADSGLNTANSQFFISLGRNASWDKRYTVFGRVIRGINEVRIISTAPVRAGTVNPDPKIVIKSITLEPRANYQ